MMTMARSLSLHRRRANLVDLTLPVRSGVISYQFQVAANFDASFSTFETVSSAGKVSKSAADFLFEASGFRGKTRFLFSPVDYSIDDTKPFWVKIRPVTAAGVGTAEAAQLILPYSSAPNRGVVISGTAPAGAGIANSLELQLPCQVKDLVIRAVDIPLIVAFEPGGSEITVPDAAANLGSYLRFGEQTVSQLFVRGPAPAAFEASFTLLR